MSRKPRGVPLPARIRKKIRKAVHFALANMEYVKGARILERYRRTYQLDDNFLYALGLLYDHAAMHRLGMIFSQGDKNWRTATLAQRAGARNYFARAETIFNQLIARNAYKAYAFFRLGVINEVRQNFMRALYFKRRAYRLIKSGRAPKIPLLIGFTYFRMGNIKKAEEWFKKDLVFYGRDDPAANMNIFLFYFLAGNYIAASSYLPKVKKMLPVIARNFGTRGVRLWHERAQKVEYEITKRTADSSLKRNRPLGTSR